VLTLAAVCALQAILSFRAGGGSVLSFYYAPVVSASCRSFPSGQVFRHAEAPKLEPEPDIASEVKKLVRGGLGIDNERPLTVADRVTPIDRWFGWDRGIIATRDDDDPFVDSSDEMSYVTVQLTKPLGIEFLEGTVDEGAGVSIGEIRAGLSAQMCDLLEAGFHLIVANDTPVYGRTFEEAIQPIVDAEGPVKLTFFKGDAVYFYGEFRPSAAWLEEYIESLKSDPEEEEQ